MKLRESQVNNELVKQVFSTENKKLKDKEEIKLFYFEFLNYCLSGDLGQAKFFVKSNDI